MRTLREADRDSIAEVVKRNDVSEAPIYAWRKRFGEMAGDEAKRLKALEGGNASLKKLVADCDLEIEVTQEIAAKKRRANRPASGSC